MTPGKASWGPQRIRSITLLLIKPRVMGRKPRPRAPGPRSAELSAGQAQRRPSSAQTGATTLLLAEALVLEPGAAWARGQADQEHRQGHQGREDASRPRNERLLDPGPRQRPCWGEAPGLVKVALPVNMWLGHRVGPGDAQATGPSSPLQSFLGQGARTHVGTSSRQRPTALGLFTLLSIFHYLLCSFAFYIFKLHN